MAILTIQQLKSRFERGDFPRQADYWDLIDTMFSNSDAGASVAVSGTAPSSPSSGDLWYSTADLKAYIYNNAWVELSPATPGQDGADGLDSTVPGPKGDTGDQGPSGVISVTSPITNSGTSTEANIGIDLSSYYTSSQVDSAIAAVVDSAPTTLNTLNELAAALGDDANYATTITSALGNKQDKVSGVSDTEIGYLDGVTSSVQTQINTKASTGKAIAMAIVFGG